MGVESVIAANAEDLEQELAWFRRVLDTRFQLYFGQPCDHESVFDVGPPDLSGSESGYAHLVRHYELSFAERLALVLSLVPHLRPHLLDVFFTRNATFDRRFTEFGGIHDAQGRFVPTGETLAFLLAGDDLHDRLAVQSLFDRDHVFVRHGLLRLSSADERWSRLGGRLEPSEDLVSFVTTGDQHRPDFGADFPARHITTDLAWSDLVLHPGTQRQVQEIETWLVHGDTLMTDWGMAPRLRPGYRSLFHGPPGTGKTITACLLGRATGLDVYRVDLSLVVSKWIGETEKNLAGLFDRAEHKGWILFFDEADALFGKRSETKQAHDRYANQGISFLLQRIETFAGVAILASNQHHNLDEAFARRFESIIYFPLPTAQERLTIWEQGFSPKATLEVDLDLGAIADEYALSGASIMNVIRYASLAAIEAGDTTIRLDDVLRGIRAEQSKVGLSA